MKKTMKTIKTNYKKIFDKSTRYKILLPHQLYNFPIEWVFAGCLCFKTLKKRSWIRLPKNQRNYLSIFKLIKSTCYGHKGHLLLPLLCI